MRLIKRFYFPDGNYADAQEMTRNKSNTGWTVEKNTIVGVGLITDSEVVQYSGYFSDEPEVKEIAKIGNYSVEGVQPEVVDAFECFEETIEQLRKAVNAINRELAELKEKSK